MLLSNQIFKLFGAREWVEVIMDMVARDQNSICLRSMLLHLRAAPYCTPPSMPLECSHQNSSLHSIHRFAHAETLIPLVCFLGLFRDKEPLLPTNFEGKENCTIILPTD